MEAVKDPPEGKTLEEAAKEEAAIPPEPPISGTKQLSFNIQGPGKKPHEAKVKMMSGEVPIDGMFDADEEVEFIVRAKMHDVKQVPIRQADVTIGFKSVFQMRPVAIRRLVPDSLPEDD